MRRDLGAVILCLPAVPWLQRHMQCAIPLTSATAGLSHATYSPGLCVSGLDHITLLQTYSIQHHCRDFSAHQFINRHSEVLRVVASYPLVFSCVWRWLGRPAMSASALSGRHFATRRLVGLPVRALTRGGAILRFCASAAGHQAEHVFCRTVHIHASAFAERRVSPYESANSIRGVHLHDSSKTSERATHAFSSRSCIRDSIRNDI